jgi:hypothetical protein
MSKTLRVTVAALVIGSVAAISPLSAQARAVPALNGSVTLDACTAGAAGATATVTGNTFTITVPSLPAGAAIEYRARVFSVVKGKQVFSTKKVRVPSALLTDSGTLPPGTQVYRLDVSNLTAEAAGLPALVYTTAGLAGCAV